MLINEKNKIGNIVSFENDIKGFDNIAKSLGSNGSSKISKEDHNY
ncbi:hypothetical protein J6TS2_36240 [Heyndrickxia sporothermodurans]|nr:hypothetical protein J6TS2_36240 [Heyndrickxia sporothermodurans]